MHIREATPADSAVLARLNTHVQDVHLAQRPEHFTATDPTATSEWFGRRLEEPGAHAWIAEVDERAVGYVLALRRQSQGNPFTRARTWFEIDQLAVDPAVRRRGIGRALLRAALAHAREEGLPVEATSWAFNDRTHALFASLGLTPKVIRFEQRWSLRD